MVHPNTPTQIHSLTSVYSIVVATRSQTMPQFVARLIAPWAHLPITLPGGVWSCAPSTPSLSLISPPRSASTTVPGAILAIRMAAPAVQPAPLRLTTTTEIIKETGALKVLTLHIFRLHLSFLCWHFLTVVCNCMSVWLFPQRGRGQVWEVPKFMHILRGGLELYLMPI